MGTWTYADFKAYLKLRMGNAASWDQYYGTFVNSAYHYLCSLDVIPGTKKKVHLSNVDLTETVSTVSGVAYVAKPTAALFINEIYDSTNNRRLDMIPYPQYVERTDRATTASYGQPTSWTRRGDNIYLYPTPGGVYSLVIDYRALPAKMTLETETSVLPTEWDNVILEMAVGVARNWVGEPEKAETANKLAVDMISGLASLYDNEEKARREKVRPDPGYQYRNGYE